MAALRTASSVAQVSLIGFFSSPTGLGAGVRRQFDALKSVGYAAEKYNVPLKHRFELELEGMSGVPLSTPDAIFHVNPPEMLAAAASLRGLRASAYLVGYWAWELPVLPSAWAGAIDLVDEIWAPTRFVAEIFEEATNKPIRVIPHPVTLNDTSREQGRAMFDLPNDRYIFLSVFDTESYPARKNPAAAVRAFLDAFPQHSESSPILVVKLHGTSHRSAELIDLLGQIRTLPSFRVIDQSLDEAGVKHLQAACDCFVSLHRSEGFGLNIAECMAARRLVITTDFSGNRDFARDDNSIPIPYSMRAVQRGEYIYGRGQWWAEPNHVSAVEAMRWAVSNPSAAARLAEKARADIASDYSYQRIGSLAATALTGRRPWARSLLPKATVEAALRSSSIAAAPAKIGRNEPCPCGSGKKFKHCHGLSRVA